MNCLTNSKGIEIIRITDIDRIKIKILGIFMLKYWNYKSVLKESTIFASFIPTFRQFSLPNGLKQPVFYWNVSGFGLLSYNEQSLPVLFLLFDTLSREWSKIPNFCWISQVHGLLFDILLFCCCSFAFYHILYLLFF